MPQLPSSHDPQALVVSFLLAGTAAWAVLGLARRVQRRGALVAYAGWAGGLLALGAGVWSWFAGSPTTAGVAGAIAVSLPVSAALRKVDVGLARHRRAAAALLTGLAACVLQRAGFPAADAAAAAGAAPAPAGGFGPAVLIALSSVALLGTAAVASALRVRMQRRAARLADSLELANTRLQQVNEELTRRAFLDPLTGLANRQLFEDRLAHALSRSERSAERIGERGTHRLAVLFVDLDRFKPVNDSLGHAAGDDVLKEIARRLRVAARASDTVARIGGDEFVLLMEDVAGLADCTTLARRLVETVGQPIEVAGQPVQVFASIGIVVHPDHGHKDKLVGHADAAMYAAKSAGGNTYTLFEPHMDARALEQMSLQTELRHAVERGQLQLHYQPKIDGLLGQIRGVEALLRWNHPQRGAIPPDVFIPLAERFGLINTLGSWVIDEACRQMAAWAEHGIRMRVAINLSVYQLREEDIVGRIERALRRHAIDPSQLLCEITESVAMEDLKATQRAFDGLGRLGVFLSIDDFGTGYSSLSYLRQMPARQLKIDRSFVADIETSGDARAIVDAVVQLAHALTLRVVAEGVETAGQRDILLAFGCDELQGFYFARPMAADHLVDWIEGRKPAGSADFSPSVWQQIADD